MQKWVSNGVDEPNKLLQRINPIKVSNSFAYIGIIMRMDHSHVIYSLHPEKGCLRFDKYETFFSGRME
jgi:hypothetical protein